MIVNEPVTWGRLTRLTHWFIAIPVMLDFFIEGGDRSHLVLGYIALGTTLFRFFWGFFTRDEANFASFPLSLKKTSQYALGVFTKTKINYSGHNPLASWAYIFIWILVIALGLTGFMMGLDQFWGNEQLEGIHESLSQSLMVLVGFHFVGLALDSWKFKRKTWMGMFTGKK